MKFFVGSIEADELAEKLNESDEWDLYICSKLCDLAGISEEWESADGETFEGVVYKAAEILGVEI